MELVDWIWVLLQIRKQRLISRISILIWNDKNCIINLILFNFLSFNQVNNTI